MKTPSVKPPRTITPEHREKISQAAKKRYADPKEREAQAERLRAAYQQQPELRRMHSPDACAKRGDTLRQKWTTEDYRSGVLAARSTPAAKERRVAAATEAWAAHHDDYVIAIQKSRRTHITAEHQAQLEDPVWLQEQNKTRTITDIAAELGAAQSLLSVQFAKFGLVPISHPMAYTGGEALVEETLRSRWPEIVIETHNRALIAPYEIDIYLPMYRVGIEYHGTYWHSYDHPETSKERQRHRAKADAAAGAGIRLLQFWDHEWLNTPEICLSIIQTAMGVTGQNQSIGARQCTISTPTRNEVKVFLTAHHIQGDRPSSRVAGLYGPTGELLMVMSLGKSRYVKGAWELLRLSTKSGYQIMGGASRLWAHLTQLLPSGATVYTYADKRLFTGKVYSTLGFTWSHDTPPGYSYCRGSQVISRLRCQKHKLAKFLAVYDDSKTEAENMFANGYRRLWDAGQSVWVAKKP